MNINFSELSDLADKQFVNYKKTLNALLDAPESLKKTVLGNSGLTQETFIVNGSQMEYVKIDKIDFAGIVAFGRSEARFTLIVSFPVAENTDSWSIAIPIVAKYDSNANLVFKALVISSKNSEIDNWYPEVKFTMTLTDYLKECLEFNPIIGGSFIPPIIID